MFCSNCGRQLSDGARFCTACGQKVEMGSQTIPVVHQPNATPHETAYPSVSQPPYQPVNPPQVQSGGEQVLMVLQTNRKYSMMKMTPCYLVFMPDKIILAHLSKERQKEENTRLSQEIKASGKGFFKGSAAMMGYWADYYKRYYQMTSQQIAAEDHENMIIPNQAVSHLLFHAYDTDYSSDGSQRTSGGKIQITPAGGETLKFSHSIGHKNSIRDTLYQLFGPRLKYKR